MTTDTEKEVDWMMEALAGVHNNTDGTIVAKLRAMARLALADRRAAVAAAVERAAEVCGEIPSTRVERLVLRHAADLIRLLSPQGSPLADMREVLNSIGDAIAFDVADWSLDKRRAWIYGVVLGWGDAIDEIAEKFGWDVAAVERLKRLHSAIARWTGGMEA